MIWNGTSTTLQLGPVNMTDWDRLSAIYGRTVGSYTYLGLGLEISFAYDTDIVSQLSKITYYTKHDTPKDVWELTHRAYKDRDKELV